MKTNRRTFLKNTSAASAGIMIGGLGMSAKSYGRILGANDRVHVGILGFSDRFNGSLKKAFHKYADDMNFEFTALADLWSRRREEGAAAIKDLTGRKIKLLRNSDELWEQNLDAVIISTADFQHSLLLAEAVNAGCDVYCEKPFAETMDDAITGLSAARDTGKVIQIGSQRRSGPNYQA
ncbi:MAG TPA: Gfo/Idh/MocA family oxidoreductase, partial [Bacteroidales bacterium]|nr:Gfo/Idh/MocA family oxidoreductase [Bacteroidales bacterium]